MSASDLLGTVVFLVTALLLAVMAAVFDVPTWQRAAIAVAAVLVVASGALLTQTHPADVPARAAAFTILFVVQAARLDSLLIGGGAVLMAAITLVELYNWRSGTTYLRL